MCVPPKHFVWSCWRGKTKSFILVAVDTNSFQMMSYSLQAETVPHKSVTENRQKIFIAANVSFLQSWQQTYIKPVINAVSFAAPTRKQSKHSELKTFHEQWNPSCITFYHPFSSFLVCSHLLEWLLQLFELFWSLTAPQQVLLIKKNKEADVLHTEKWRDISEPQ